LLIIIVGGGITGLAAAFELSLRGVPFQLLEASARAGGLIHTEHADGFTIEAGPDSLLAQKPAGVGLCEELGLGPRLISTTPPRTAFVLKDGRLHALPSPSALGLPWTWRGIASYDLLSWPARLRLALEPLVPRRRAADEPVAAFFRRRFGSETVGLIAEPLLGGIHAGDVETLSLRSLFPRFAEAESKPGGVLRSFRRAHRPGGSDGLFRSLSSGMGELVTAIERRLPERAIRYRAPATSLGRDGRAWRVRAGDDFEARAGAVVLAAPAHAAARLLQPVDAAAAALCREVPYVSTASVALAWPRDAIRHPLAGSGFVVARRHNALRITACTWVSSKWQARAPAGMTLLRAFVGGAHDPHAVDLTDDELVALAAREIGGVLGIDGPPRLARVFRWREAGAQHNVGQIARVARIEESLAAHGGLFVAGSGFRSVGIPDCVADGRAAAESAAHYVRTLSSS
jgi:protoporphyrinogen/coproporphyrinogen III oxidase